jgi:hypothetical protein
MTVPEEVCDIICRMEGDIIEAGSLAAILHDKLSERKAIRGQMT